MQQAPNHIGKHVLQLLLLLATTAAAAAATTAAAAAAGANDWAMVLATM